MKKFIIIVIICTAQVELYSQSIFQFIERHVGLLEYTYLDSGKKYNCTGTGTLIFKSLDSRNDFGYMFLITNTHVLPKFKQSKTIDFYIADSDSSNNFYNKITIPIYQIDGSYDLHVKVSKDEDLAVIEVSKLIENTPVSKIPYISSEFLATKEMLRSHMYNIGDVVFFIGYPNSFYNRKDYSPVFRTGYVSSNPLKNFYFSPLLKQVFKRDSLNGFLIDANVFAGSSGSLVFSYPTLLDPEFYKDGHALIENKKADTWILGVLTESYFTTSQNEYSQRLNIGGVISSDKILEVINSYNYRNK